MTEQEKLNEEFRLFYRLERLEAAAIQLGIDLGELRADQSRRVQEMGGKL